jgi:Rad3-related DNA helicase
MLFNADNVSEEYVLVNEHKKFTVKELYGKRAFNNIIKPQADKFLFMSSTILNKSGFCRDLGINPDEAAFLSLESEFETDKRMVIYSPTTKMNYGWDSNEPKRVAGRAAMIKKIRQLLDLHKDVSGIIHTGSFKLSKWIIDELQTHHSHLVLHHNPVEDEKSVRDSVIAEYMESALVQPTLLVSPSITEGLDLKHDLGRFAIFAKVPYPNLGDAWIKRRMEISGDWYRRQTLKEMIQGSGRICRDHTDWGVTYILDESFTYLYKMTRHGVIPHWWQDGLEII